jgi:EmrB/QacA subfamily drug resistance transporter
MAHFHLLPKAGNRSAEPAAPQSPRGPNPNWALLASILGTSMIFADSTAVNVALPVLQRDLRATAAAAQWVVEGYTLLLSALILIGGSLGDIFGRRLTFGCGIALFTVASAACAAAPNIDVLIAARCVQGVGGALATPGSLALLSANFAAAARGRAIGTWSAFSVIVSAVGPVLGGWLVQAFSWRWIFTLNIPLAAIVLAVLALRVTESRDPSASRQVDVRGAALATAGLGALVFGLIRLQGNGGDAAGWFCVPAGTSLLALFISVERHTSAPMLQLSVFDSRAVGVTTMYTFLLYAALGGSLYFVPFDLINVQHYAPAAAGAALLPMTIILFTLSRFSGGLVARFGARPLLAGGALLAALGFAVFAAAGVGRPYSLTILPATTLLGFGATAFVAPLTTLVMSAVPAAHAGVASGINNAVARVAGLVAIALLGIVASAVVNTSIDVALTQKPPLSAATRGVLKTQRAVIVSGALPAGITPAVERARVERTIVAASANGFAVTMLLCSALAACAAVLALDGSLAQVEVAGREPASERAAS